MKYKAIQARCTKHEHCVDEIRCCVHFIFLFMTITLQITDWSLLICVSVSYFCRLKLKYNKTVVCFPRFFLFQTFKRLNDSIFYSAFSVHVVFLSFEIYEYASRKSSKFL